jgi:hypothetical protein
MLAVELKLYQYAKGGAAAGGGGHSWEHVVSLGHWHRTGWSATLSSLCAAAVVSSWLLYPAVLLLSC